MTKLSFAKIIRKIQSDYLMKSIPFQVPSRVTTNSEKLLKDALNILNKLGLDFDELVSTLIPLIENMLQADRITIWALDRKRNELFTRCLIGDSYQEVRIQIIANTYLRKVVESGQPINIPFDAYDSEYLNSKTAIYRVCSVLCLPIFAPNNQLIGILQILNKTKPGQFPPYHSNQWPEAPEQWRTSFDETDLKLMKILNIKLGNVLHNVLVFQDGKKREMIQMDILQQFPYPFCLTNRNGQIIVINPAAKNLLNLENIEKISKKSVFEIFNIKGRKLDQCFQGILNAKTEPEKTKYYWNQFLVLNHNPQKNINVNVWMIALKDNGNKQNIYGILMVFEVIKNSYN